MKSRKHLTRFTYENTDFRGWRLCITRNGHSFVRYFGDVGYGGTKKALAHADKSREWLKEKLDSAETLADGKIGKRVANRIKRELMKV